MSSTRFLAKSLPFVVIGSAAAASLHHAPLHRRDEPQAASSTSIRFTNIADPFNFAVVNINGDDNIIYTANITVDGQSYEVQLDTGSSDFWLNTQNMTLSPNVNDTGVKTTITYADTSDASGDIFVTPAQFGNFSIPSQAFINAPGSNATYGDDLGLLGLSSANISQVFTALQNTSFNGLPPLYNIFAANPNVSQYMTFLLARSDLGHTDGGIFTIGEVNSDWSAVQNQTKIPVISFLEQWIGLMDGMIVGGKNITGHGLLAKVKKDDVKDKTLALLDTGTSLGVLPQYYWDAIYKDIPGLKLVDEPSGTWSLPCDTKLNVSFVFNGTEYPVNPIDLTRVTSLGNYESGSNETICANTFFPQDQSNDGLDLTLGDSFMRNVYALFNFGNWTSPGTEGPYMQLLSTTNQSAAWEQFDQLNNVRIQQWNELGGQFNSSDSSTTSSA